MVRKLYFEIHGIAGQDPGAMFVRTEDGERVELEIPVRGGKLNVNADDLIYLARALEGMRRPR